MEINPWFPCQKHTIVFNGEIYNHGEADDLIKRDINLERNAIIILALFELDYDSPELMLDGMFAFAVFDKINNSVILSRDLTGKKPLFYKLNNDGVVFASEQKALKFEKSNIFDLDTQSLSDFLTLGYIPQPATIVSEFKQVPAGGRIKFGKCLERDQWQKRAPFVSTTVEQNQIINSTKLLLKNAIGKRITREVPMGLFLSSGLDSSLILQ